MPLILLGIIVFCVVKVCCAISMRKRELESRRQMARIQAEQQRMKAESKAVKQRQVALEREQMKLANEQKKQAEQIAKLEFKMSEAERNIEHYSEQLGNLYALLDIAQNQQMMAVPGSKADVSAQNKIISLESRIHTAERKLDKAKFDKEQAERKLA